ncbi:c-type cytochrome [Abyssalbus ytuae]|uniref:Cytochrome c n=1 Tax=Abyssalbus ytuae TaxID=2926907 RepID=A0A9E6ZLX2_9FLAO|nr:cytochrome c [Abyssalbus ytuae]UOB18227.1 cytochrome c [Abyssalbus ytuae]
MKKNVFPIIVTILLLCLSCSKDEEGGQITTDPVDTDVTYSQIESIIQNRCGSCHGNPTANGAPMSTNTYETLKEAGEKRNLIGRIKSINNPMPPDGLLPQEQIELIEGWVLGGYKQ